MLHGQSETPSSPKNAATTLHVWSHQPLRRGWWEGRSVVAAVSRDHLLPHGASQAAALQSGMRQGARHKATPDQTRLLWPTQIEQVPISRCWCGATPTPRESVDNRFRSMPCSYIEKIRIPRRGILALPALLLGACATGHLQKPSDLRPMRPASGSCWGNWQGGTRRRRLTCDLWSGQRLAWAVATPLLACR